LVFLCSEECLSVAKLAFDSLHGLGDDQRQLIPPAPLDDQKPGRKLGEIKKPSPKRLGFFMQRGMPERSEAGF
jgi:hypothetical protein